MSLVKTPNSKNLGQQKIHFDSHPREIDTDFIKRWSRNVHYSFIHNNWEHQPERINKLEYFYENEI